VLLTVAPLGLPLILDPVRLGMIEHGDRAVAVRVVQDDLESGPGAVEKEPGAGEAAGIEEGQISRPLREAATPRDCLARTRGVRPRRRRASLHPGAEPLGLIHDRGV
jgi:hypothetical protein